MQKAWADLQVSQSVSKNMWHFPCLGADLNICHVIKVKSRPCQCAYLYICSRCSAVLLSAAAESARTA